MADELTLAFAAIRDLGARNSTLQTALRELQEKCDAIQKNDDHEEIEASILREEIEVHKASILRLTTTLQQEKERYDSEIQKKDALIVQYVEDFRSETTQLGKSIISKDQTIVDLRNEVKDLRMGISRRDASLLKKKERLIALRRKVQNEADSYLKIIQREKECNAKLQEKVDEVSDSNATLRGEAAIHLEFIQREKEFSSKLQEKVDDVSESNSTLQKKVDTMTSRMKMKDDHIQFLTTANKEFNEDIEKMKTQTNLNESAALKKKDEHIQFLTTVNKELNEDIGFEEKNKEISRLQQRIVELTGELGTSEAIKLIDNKMASLEQHMTSIETGCINGNNVAFGSECVIGTSCCQVYNGSCTTGLISTGCVNNSFNCNANSDLKFENGRLSNLLKKLEDSLTSSRMNCEEIEMKNTRLADTNDEYKSKLANANMQTKRLEAEVAALKKKILEREKDLEEKQRRLVTSLRDIATSDHSYFHTSSSSCSHHLQ